MGNKVAALMASLKMCDSEWMQPYWLVVSMDVAILIQESLETQWDQKWIFVGNKEIGRAKW